MMFWGVSLAVAIVWVFVLEIPVWVFAVIVLGGLALIFSIDYVINIRGLRAPVTLSPVPRPSDVDAVVYIDPAEEN
jgi:hypothetical protein